MLSECEIKPCYARHSLPPLAEPINVRIKFRKVGMLKFISHLDLQRTLARVLVRAGIPMWYTQGFNPHAKMVFAMPLSVGTESECEYLDVRIDREISCEKIKEQLNRELTDELSVLDVYLPDSKFTQIAFAEYEYIFKTRKNAEALCGEIKDLFSSSPLVVMKKTKSGEKETDIAPLIRSFEVCVGEKSGEVKLVATLNASPDSFLNPEMLVAAIRERLGVLSDDDADEYYTVFRKRVLTSDGKTEFH